MSEKKFFKNRKLKINAVPKFAKIGIIFSFFRLFFQFPDIIFSFLNDPGKGGPEDIMYSSNRASWILQFGLTSN